MNARHKMRSVLGAYFQVAGFGLGILATRLDRRGKLLVDDGGPRPQGHDWKLPLESPVRLNREGAAAWALAHLDDPESIVPNCAYFVSDSLRLGGELPETRDWQPGVRRGRVRRSHPIARHPAYGCVGDFVIDMQRSGRARLIGVDTFNDVLDGAQLGDVIVYNWDGRGKYQHVAIVTKLTAAATLVSQQTPTQRNRAWNRYGNGGWINTAALLRFATPGTPEAPNGFAPAIVAS